MPVPSVEQLLQHARLLGGRIWRVVEDQNNALTRQLVNNHAEQERLEELLEGQSKPAYLPGTEHLDYLLKTPFRYRPPKRSGSRFRAPFQGYGVFYGAEAVRTALAEFAYHRYRFFRASPGTDLPQGEEALTVFAVDYATESGIDLTQLPLSRDRPLWTAPADYAAPQTLGFRASEAGIGAIRYESVRDPETDAQGLSLGRNLAVLDPRSFDPPRPQCFQTWYLYLGSQEASFRRAMASQTERVDFPRAQMDTPGP